MRDEFVFRSKYLEAAADLLNMICRYGIYGIAPRPREGYHEGAVLLFLSRIQPMMDKDLSK